MEGQIYIRRMKTLETRKTRKISDYVWELPRDYREGMNVPGRIYCNEKILSDIEEGAFKQCANVACLPGIIKYSIAMPDIHFGYGFPIGGVAAFDEETGVISPGGVGFDINCGVRLLRTDLQVDDVRKKIKDIIDHVFFNVPSGVGRKGKIRISVGELDNVLENGAKWAVEKGYGWEDDRLEENRRERMHEDRRSLEGKRACKEEGRLADRYAWLREPFPGNPRS